MGRNAKSCPFARGDLVDAAVETHQRLERIYCSQSKGVAFGLCFDCSDGFAVNKKEVIDFIALFQKSFANCNSSRSREIDRAAILQDPAALL
jgi:hypothetical protein